MQRYGVLVVDDSSFMRKSISMIIEKDPQFFIVGIARDGADAIEKIQRLKPDVVTMDVEMPVMDGITALEKIMNVCPVPVMMLSNYTQEGAQITVKALELGAADFFDKGELIKCDVKEGVIYNFLNRLKIIAKSKKYLQQDRNLPYKDVATKTNRSGDKVPLADLLIIGTSTGGPAALQSILPHFPQDTQVPILVLQHMPPGFTRALAERFNTFCNLHVKEAEEGDVLEAGNIYIAPAGFQTLLNKRNDGKVSIKTEESSDEKILYKPSVNVTLNSAAPIYKERLLVVILTGMGNDGLEGCRTVKKYNGHVIVEAEESCVVYGMPRAVYEAGLADIQVPLPSILNSIMIYI